MGFIKETTLFATNLEKDLAGKDIEYGKLVDNLLLQCLGEDLDDLPEDGDVFFAAFRRKYHLLKLVFQKLLVVNYDFFVRSVLFGNTYAREEDIRLAKEKGLLTKIPAEELYSFFIHFNSDASYVLFRDLDCPLTEVELLRTSLADRNKDLFVETFNRIKCDKSSLYFVAGTLGTAFEFIMKAFVEPQDVYNYLYCTIPNGIPALIRNSVPGFKEQIESYIKSYKGDDNVDENKRPSSKEELQVLEQNALQSMDGSILTTLSSAKQVIIEMERVSELFPFEKAYVDSIVNNPELQPYFEQLPDTVETKSAPEEETIVDDMKQSGIDSGVKKSNAGAPQKIWITNYGTEEELTKKIQSVQPSLRGELKEMGLNDRATQSASSAIIIYSVYCIGLTKEKMCTAPAERVVKAPRTTVNLYLKRLYEWYDKLIRMSGNQRNASKVPTLTERWKEEDAPRADFIINNFAELKRVINNTKFVLGNEFGKDTGLQYIPKREKSDAVLGGAIDYSDEKDPNNQQARPVNLHPLSGEEKSNNRR